MSNAVRGVVRSPVRSAISSGVRLVTKKLIIPGSSGDNVTTPDTEGNSITSSIDIRAKVAMDDWTPAADSAVISKYTGVQRSYYLALTTGGNIRLVTSANGTAGIISQSSVSTGLTNGTVHWIRSTWDDTADDANYYIYSGLKVNPAASDFILLGAADVTHVGAGIFDSTTPLEIGSNFGGAASLLAGQVSRVQIYDGIDGTLVVDCTPSDGKVGTEAWTSASTGEVWAPNGNTEIQFTA